MYSFCWTYEHTLDEKGRLAIPADIRHVLRDEDRRIFVVSRGIDNCLFVFPKTAWDERLKQKTSGFLTKKELYARKQALSSWSRACVMDSQNRIKIPDELLKYAGLERELIIAGVEDRLELWDKAKYETHQSELEFDPDEIIEETLL